ncbi:OmpA family protein [Stagnimonas aquatica]|uniref:OmpA family protein n=1 Tax=Stagnimonas aquatica TaxID=2689987 RepID=A0A3N0V7V6_9GAMM|nr:OmpA family protein [Stagnimonas aquatica]ROH88692.1 OmpA family protein [Stagnimonas aquatica]
MNHYRKLSFRTAPLAAAALLLAACGANPVKPEGADQVRAELTALQTNPDYASRAPVALQEAESAVRQAETPTADTAAGSQAVYVAERKVAIARAQAEKRLAEDQVRTLSDQRNAIRLDARTAEAEAAKSQAEQAIAIAQAQQQAALAARSEAEAAKAEAEELRRQMEDLQAKQTDRGLVMTLGDVLFATGKADLKAGSAERLNKLVAFLGKYPDRTVVIEGHTDSTGSEATNQRLSQQRAEAVRAYLLSQGVAANRVSAVGKGESLPVADNATAAGRQQNRRVEIVISNVLSR